MKIDRRKFLEFILFLSLPFSKIYPDTGKKGKVVLIRNKNLFDSKNKINKSVLREMICRGICLLEGEESVENGLKKIFKKDEIIGIKTNEWEPLPTPMEVEEILKDLLIKFGIKEENLGISDRRVLKLKIFQNCTSLINVRPMRTHHWSGVGTLIKNYIMFTENPSKYHPNFCSNLGAIWHLPIVEGKTRLNLLIMFTPLFYGVGRHHFDLKYTWKYCGILFGKKPATVDAVGLKILKEKRAEYFGKEVSFQPPPIHILAADKVYNLGTTNFNEIELIKPDPMADDLI